MGRKSNQMLYSSQYTCSIEVVCVYFIQFVSAARTMTFVDNAYAVPLMYSNTQSSTWTLWGYSHNAPAIIK